MPVSPEDCLALSKDDKALIEKLHNHIDNILLSSYVENNYNLTIDVGVIGVKVFNSIYSSYTGVGWSIKTETDKNGCLKLSFTKKRN